MKSVRLPVVDGVSQREVSVRDFEEIPREMLATEPRWQLAQRIVVSRSFAKSALLSRFLLYVCEREITGRLSEISEYQIGVHVFGRRPGYHPGEDNIVRSYARQLRVRLNQYFSEEGRDEELCLSIPRGKYVPVYSPNHRQERPLLAVMESAPNAAALQPVRGQRWVFVSLGVLLAVCFALAWAVAHRASADDPVSSSHALWALLFDENHQTIVVPSDAGIAMIQNLTGHLVPLAEYVNRDYLFLKSPNRMNDGNMRSLGEERYTNITDLNAVVRFLRLPEAKAGRFAVRYARELHMEDLKDTNIILLGSSFSNPWAELFEKNMNFVFSFRPHLNASPSANRIVNRHPQAGELPFYENDATGPSHRTYGVIGLVPNLNNTGWVLLAEGLTMAGTEAAMDTLFDASTMRPLLKQLRNAGGSFNSFELLIQTMGFESDSPQASVVATRIYRKHS